MMAKLQHNCKWKNMVPAFVQRFHDSSQRHFQTFSSTTFHFLPLYARRGWSKNNLFPEIFRTNRIFLRNLKDFLMLTHT